MLPRRSSTLALVGATMILSASAQADMFKPGVKDQIALGKRASQQVHKEEKVLGDDDFRVREVRRIGARLIAQIPAAEMKKKPFEYTFDVVNSKEVNAFALPGGPIFLYTGLLDKLKYEDEIAGVLAHEITHVRNEHWASAYADNQKRRLGLTVLLTIFNASDTVFNIASVSDTLLFQLPYSRKHESESDRIGYEMAGKADFNPEGMLTVFEILKSSGGGGKGTEWASSHPAADSRIKAIRERLAKDPKKYPDQTLRRP